MDLRYPIGKFEKPELIDDKQLSDWIKIIADFPREIIRETELLTTEQLNTPYREGGWTIRQVVHHCADSHMNAFMRFKLALTETDPVIRPYHEALWAELPDCSLALEPSYNVLKGLHERWSKLLESLEKEDLKRTFIHPERKQQLSLDVAIGMYAWHSRHHLTHITVLKGTKGW